MDVLRLVFSPSGRLTPQAFIAAALAIYATGAVSQLLTMPDVLVRFRLWPYGAVQAVLVWVWYVVHIKRLREANSPTGLAAAAALLYALSVVLLLIIAVEFFSLSAATMSNASASSALGLILMISIVSTLAGSTSYDAAWFIVTILTVMAVLPLLIAFAVTVWAATRRSAGTSVGPNIGPTK